MRSANSAPIFSAESCEPLHIDDCKNQFRAIKHGKIELHALTRGHYPGTRIDSNTLLGLASIGYWNALTLQDWGLKPHRNEGIEITFQETGSNTFFTNQQKFDLSAGSFAITRPWQPHHLGDPFINRGKLFWLIIDVNVRNPNDSWSWPSWLTLTPADLHLLTDTLLNQPTLIWQASNRIRSIFSDLAHAIQSWPHSHAESRLTISINQLILEILLHITSPHLPDSKSPSLRRAFVTRFLDELALSPASCSQPWSIKSMADHCQVGVTALTQYCRDSVNQAPMAYLNHCRLQHATQAILRFPHRSITEIALDHGFNSSQYFATLFKKHHHLSPSQFRLLSLNHPKP